MSNRLYELFPGKTGSGDNTYEETAWVETTGPGNDASIAANTRLRLGPDAFGFGEECLRLITRPGSGNCYIDMVNADFGTYDRGFFAIDFAVGSTDLLDKAADSYHSIFRVRDSGTGNCMLLSLIKRSSALKLKLNYRNNGADTACPTGDEPTLQVGTAYRLECYYTGSAYSGTKECIWKLNGVVLGTYALTGTIRANVGAVRVGFIDAGSPGDETTLYVYRVVADDAAWVGARPVNDYAYQNIAWMDQITITEITASVGGYIYGIGWDRWQQLCYLVGFGGAVAGQNAYAAGFETLAASKDAYVAGATGLVASKLAYVNGQASYTPITGAAPAYLSAFDRATVSKAAYTAGFGQIVSSKAAFVQGGLNILASQGAFVQGSGDYLSAQKLAYLAAYGQVSGLARAYVVCGFPLDHIGFKLGQELLVFSCGRNYPVREPRERLQVVSRTAGGTLRVQDKGIGTRTLRLAFNKLNQDTYDALIRWYEEIAVGALNAFTFIDEAGTERQVRWLGALVIDRTHHNAYAGEIVLEDVSS